MNLLKKKPPFLVALLFLAVMPQILKAQPVISYIIPDIGTPGMNTYMEVIAPVDSLQNYGVDGFYFGNRGDIIQLVCANPSDTQYVRFGPCIVSWNGRMISTQVYVLPWVKAVSSDWQQGIKIPIKVLFDGDLSNADTFYIVKPQTLDPTVTLSNSGTIGTGGGWGSRSRRGAMILDSLILAANGTYTFSTADCDQRTTGNQGYLPLTIISKGNISVASSTTLDASATLLNGGPGGGGGGNGLVCYTQGGDGFTGGGGNSNWYSGCTVNPSGSGSGFAPDGLNGVHGGEFSFQNEGGGGGTGHPFGGGGSAGFFPGGPSNPPGSAGGGNGGPECCSPKEGGGGGAGFAIRGFDGGNISLHSSAGSPYGNLELVPLSGGSGGGGGNVNSSISGSGAGSGGGGGGALILYGKTTQIKGLVKSAGSNGADGAFDNAAGGGGSGGAIICGAKLLLNVGKADVSAGVGGTGTPIDAGQDGGSGSPGRVRFDGPRSSVFPITSRATKYDGPSTDASDTVTRTFTLTGSGNSNEVRIYVKPLSGQWSQVASVTGYISFGNKWTTTITLPGNDTIYLLAAGQRVNNPSNAKFTAEPSWVLSQAAANILYVQCPDSGIVASDSLIDFGKLSLCADVFDTLIISNIGCSDAAVSALLADQTLGASISRALKPTIAVQKKDTIVLHLHPNQKGPNATTLTVHTTEGDITVPVMWIGDQSAANLSVSPPSVDLGSLSRCSEVFDTIVLENLGCDSLALSDSIFDASLGLDIFRRSKSLLATGAKDTIILHFKPKNLGPFQTAFHLRYADKDSVLSVKGNVLPGDQLVEFTPPKIDFGTITTCQTVFDTIYFKSTGCDTLRLQASIDDRTSGATIIRGPKSSLPQGDNDTVIISFRPHRTGLISVNIFLSFQGNDSTIGISAFGVNDSTPVILSFDPLLQAFQCGDDKFMVTLSNPTCDSLTILSYSLSGKDTSDFQLSTVTPLGIGAGSSSDISGTFTPLDSGAKNATVTFHLSRSDGSLIDTTIKLSGLGILQNIRVTLPPTLPSVYTLQKVNIPILSLDSSILPISIFDFALHLHTDLLDPSIDGSSGLFAGAIVDRFTIFHDSISVRLRLASPKQVVPGVLCTIVGQAYVSDTLATYVALQRSSLGTLSSGIQCLATTNLDSVLFTLKTLCGDSSVSHFLAGRLPYLGSISPNPGTGIEKISYYLPVSSSTKIEVYNQLGQQLRTISYENETSGNHDHEFDISDLPSGSYFLRVAMGEKSETRTIELIK